MLQTKLEKYESFKANPRTAEMVMEPEVVALKWQNWCGPNRWSKALLELPLGWKVVWFCGFPQSGSAIPLCFSLVRERDGLEITGSKIKGIRRAIEMG